MAALPQEQEIFSEGAVSSAIQRAATLMGYEKLKNEQFNAVSAVLAGKDTLLLSQLDMERVLYMESFP